MIEPTPGWVLVEPYEEKQGFIKMPDSSKEETNQGTVISIGGEGITQAGAIVKVPSALEAGNVIFYKKYGGHELKFAGKTYFLVHLENLLAIIRPE